MDTANRFDELLSDAAHTAWRAYRHAVATLSPTDRRRPVGDGATGAPTYLIDQVVERAVLDVVLRAGVNVLSDEAGWIDQASAVTVVLDPVDGSANAVAGVPISGFAAAVVVDDVIEQSRILWFETGREWAATRGRVRPATTSNWTSIDSASISMPRPRHSTMDAWTRLADRARSVRVLGSTVLEAALVADGVLDLFCDPGGDVHSFVDIAATKLLVESSGGCVRDLHGRPFEFAPELATRWSGVFAASPALADDAIAAISTHALVS